MISLLIPHRGINVCSAFDKKKQGAHSEFAKKQWAQGSRTMEGRLEKRLLETLSGIPHVFPEDMTEASPKMEPTDGDIETSFGC